MLQRFRSRGLRREGLLRIQTCAISARGMIAEELYGAKAVSSEKENTDIV